MRFFQSDSRIIGRYSRKALAPVIDGVRRVMVECKNKLAAQADAKKRKGKGDVMVRIDVCSLLREKLAVLDAVAGAVCIRTIAAVGVGEKDSRSAYVVEMAHDQGEGFLTDLFDSAYAAGVSEEDKALTLACAAILGHGDSMHDLGWCFHFGKGVATDYELAIHWHTQAAERGDAYAMQNLGRIYTEEGSPVWDGPKGIAWYEKAVAKGDPSAKGDLAHCLLCGKCVPKDETRAEQLLMQAVRSNSDREDWQEDLARCPLAPGEIRNRCGQKMRQVDVDFYDACRAGTVNELRALVERGANPDAPRYNDIGDDLYAIHEAALNPDIEVLKYVISLGVDPCRTDFWWRQPLAFAVRKNSLEMVQFLVELGNDPCREDMDGKSVLSEAALNPDIRVVEYLISKGAEIDACAEDRSELGYALTDGTPERMKFFMDRGADLQRAMRCKAPWAPLENLRFALENGFDPNTFDDGVYADGHREKIIDRLDPQRQALFMEFGGKIHWKDAEKWNTEE